MLTSRKRMTGALLGIALGFCCAVPALADDTEIYAITPPEGESIVPNILFIVDTSGSMSTADAEKERKPYDYDGGTYAVEGNCKAGRIFYRREGEDQPTCDSTNYFLADRSQDKCKAMRDAVGYISGRWIGKAAMYDSTAKQWRDLKAADESSYVECLADSGKHGIDSTSTKKYAQNGDSKNLWTDNVARVIDWNQRPTYTFYAAEWLNWYRETAPTSTLSRLDAVKQAVIGLASSVDGVNLGLMRYSNNGGRGEYVASGGYVVQAVGDVTNNRAKIIEATNNFNPDGNTPLSETLYEAYLYYSGGNLRFGDDSVPGKSYDATGATIDKTTYKSPISGECQKNFVIYLTDGLPTSDREANDDISKLDHGVTGACTLSGTQKATDDGICLDDMAHYMANNDVLSTRDKQQTVSTYTIGFGKDVKGLDFLTEVAAAGNGERYDASNSEELTEVLTKITSDALSSGTTFTTASVGVNAFNRAQTRDELYFALFAPNDKVRWDGNLKKYKLAVVDENGDSDPPPKLIVRGVDPKFDAINQSEGTFADKAQSFWSAEPDGNQTTEGGAASRLPETRTILTYLGTNPAGTGAGTLVALDPTATNADFGAGTTDAQRQAAVDLAYSRNEQRMGDPLHSQPAVVTYSANDDGTAVDRVFIATNDGFIHSIDAATGIENWAFIPKELLPRLKTLAANPGVSTRSYGLDGDISILRLDKNGDGIIDTTTDRVWLYVGMRRGGHSYYALDITKIDDPKLLWFDDASALPGVGETWSTPVVARADIQGASQNDQKLVLIFGGGYDGAQENITQVDDLTGNRIFMVDAKYGTLLWYGTDADDTAGTDSQKGVRTTFTDMKNSIPGRVTVLDIDGDLFADRMYAADMGGRVWRFDITKGNPASTLVAGGILAKLGQGGVATPAIADTRRFYNAPDVSLVQRRGADPYYNIAIGSGYRGHPLNLQTVDRFYSIRDKRPFAKLAKGDYGTPLTDDQLENITTNLGSTVTTASAGWRYIFSANTGEKVLNESTTAADVILVSTYQPDVSGGTIKCQPRSRNRVYAFSVDNGGPQLDLNRDGKIDKDDISTEVKHEGILGNVNIGLLRGKLADDLKSKDPGLQTVCLAGMHILGQCVQVDDSVRTYWRRDYDSTN